MTENKTAFEKFLEENGLKEEVAEVTDEIYKPTGYPEPAKAYRLVLENYGSPVEQIYYWFLNHLRHDQNYPNFIKLVDTFSASESSSFFGNMSQRIGIQQDKVGGYLRVISELIKQLFQIVRELRMIDEKMAVRKAWNNSETGEKFKSADVTLKGEFVELVEGGAKEVNSVYGLAREVGYHILPDLFFNTRVYSTKDIDDIVNPMEYNERVKNVLRKKLFNFVNWVEQTNKEFKDRREFELKYMYQHWQTIRTYLVWIKPYLRNIKRMTMKKQHLESVDIISAFETSIIEIEIMAHKPEDKGTNSCLLLNFYYNTKPEMSFHTRDDYQQKGPIHVGKVNVDIRAYGWSDKTIKEFQEYRNEEDLELLGLADYKIQSAIEMLGDTFKKYLEECGDIIKNEKEEKPKKKIKQGSMISPFLDIFSGFAELGRAFFPAKDKNNKAIVKISGAHLSNAAKTASISAWLAYKIYKKARGLLTW